MNLKIVFVTAIIFALVIVGAYSAWYSYNHYAKVAHNIECDRFGKPDIDGTYIPPPCAYEIVPPTLWEKFTGHAPGALPVQTISGGCDQSATTTDCSTIPPSSPPPPYVPPNLVQPEEAWVSAIGTPISLFGFSFELPAGWHGSVYREAYAENVHALVQSDSNDHGFTIDCPPAGKGLEAATRLSSEVRSFTADDIGYSVAFEKWTAPGNDPWYFVWVRMPPPGDFSTDSSGTYCLAQGGATPDVEEAMRALYKSWK